MKTPARILPHPRIAAAVAALVVMACAAAASAGWFDIVPPPGRTLPEHIKRVYVREFKNDSRLYAAQADLTLMVVDAFLSDGRLDVVQSRRCDARIEGTVKDYFKVLDASGGDRIPMVQTLTMVCTVELWDPYDTDRVVPIARYTVPASIQQFCDQRQTVAETDVDAIERLQRQMAFNIVQTVLTGQPDPRKPLEEKAVAKWRQRNNPAEREPVINTPRFPKPTPSAKKPSADD